MRDAFVSSLDGGKMPVMSREEVLTFFRYDRRNLGLQHDEDRLRVIEQDMRNFGFTATEIDQENP